MFRQIDHVAVLEVSQMLEVANLDEMMLFRDLGSEIDGHEIELDPPGGKTMEAAYRVGTIELGSLDEWAQNMQVWN